MARRLRKPRFCRRWRAWTNCINVAESAPEGDTRAGPFVMELQKIRYFLALARTLNFTRAAEECHVSQPALTRAIKTLEDEFGGELIRREGRLSHLTELGQRMLPILQQCHDSAQSAKAVARSVRAGEVARFSLAVGQTVNLDILMGPLNALFGAFPGIQLKLMRGSGSEIGDLLKSGDVEVAIGGPLGETWDRLDAWPMFTEAFDLVVGDGHALAARNDLNLDVEMIRGTRFLLHRGEGISESQLGRLGEAGLDMAAAHEIDNDADLEALVASNFGVAVVPASGLQSSKVRHVPYNALDLWRTVAIYTVAGRPRSREAAALINLIRSTDWTGYAARRSDRKLAV
jgi:DNA-binding transcriptional LysR family regulator